MMIFMVAIPNLGKRQIRSPRGYVRDVGLLHALLDLETQQQLLGHPKVGVPLDKLAPAEAAPSPTSTGLAGGLSGSTEDAERQRHQILDALARCAGNQTRATKMLGTSRFALMRRLRELEIPRPRADPPTTLVE
jgi:DNA-binding NtrC family response regulator